MAKVLIIDTSILCVYLKVPFMEECGPAHDKWDYKRVEEKINSEIRQNSLLVLPLATLIETGNHIAHAHGDRYPLAKKLSDIIVKVANAEEPWAAFTVQKDLWDEESLIKLAEEWPDLATSEISIGDATIKDVAEFYVESGVMVEILTGDEGLKAYEPKIVRVPRRRR
jgi:hypothetical protein